MHHDNELGEFLRSRRERVDAATVGMIGTTRRRVSGLRREELALLAGVSASYYARLEQGRDRNPSREILEALARVLRLDDAERHYLHQLAAPPLTGDQSGPGETTSVRPGVQHLLRRWTDLPAFVVNPGRDVIATTPLAAKINPAWAVGANLVEFTFLDPRARAVYPDWTDIAAQAVAGLRASWATHESAIAPLVATLRAGSETFRELWDSRDVVVRADGDKRLAVPGIGVLRLRYETFAVTGPHGHMLYVYFPDENSDEAGVIERLARERLQTATT